MRHLYEKKVCFTATIGWSNCAGEPDIMAITEALSSTNLAMMGAIDADALVQQCQDAVESLDNVAIWEMITGRTWCRETNSPQGLQGEEPKGRAGDDAVALSRKKGGKKDKDLPEIWGLLPDDLEDFGLDYMVESLAFFGCVHHSYRMVCEQEVTDLVLAAAGNIGATGRR